MPENVTTVADFLDYSSHYLISGCHFGEIYCFRLHWRWWCCVSTKRWYS